MIEGQIAHDTDGVRRPTPDEFRKVIGHFASGVTVITTAHAGRLYGATASAVTSLSADPPMLLVCMNKQSDTGQAITLSGGFAVNILHEDHAHLAIHFAGKSPDKFGGVVTTTGRWHQPLLDGALATLECRVTQMVTGGTHVVFLADVLGATARPGAPLAYFRGRFGKLRLDDEPVGVPALAWSWTVTSQGNSHLWRRQAIRVTLSPRRTRATVGANASICSAACVPSMDMSR
jgi:flavin reductase (DIM6/NTAB) family NADH-FMN oxidoreductase RutF